MAQVKRRRIQKPPILFERSQRLIAELEKRLEGQFLSYWSSANGSVCQDDVNVIHEHCRGGALEGKPLHLLLKSAGGSGRAALRIINLLRQYTSRLAALVPLECASAATMVALGADEILMGPLAFLTAVDTSLRHELSPSDIDNELVSVSQDELARVIRLWKGHSAEAAANPVGALMPYVHPLVIGAVDRASSLSIRLCQEILSYHEADSATAERISTELNSAYPSHDYPIVLKEAQRIGLKAKPMDSGVNTLLLELNAVYSEMGKKALTDFDERNYHDNEIVTIIERAGSMFYFQTDKDWHYRKEERRWSALNDESSWIRLEGTRRRPRSLPFYIR
jgi:hypothetical protein